MNEPIQKTSRVSPSIRFKIFSALIESINDGLIVLAGGNLELLRHCLTERQKFINQGLALFGAALWAFAAFTLFIHESSHNLPIAVAVGLVWGCLVAVMDRGLLLTLRKSKNEQARKKEHFLAGLRIAMIIVMSFLVSDAAIQHIFSSTIQAELVEMVQEKSKAARDLAVQQYALLIKGWEARKQVIEAEQSLLRSDWQQKADAVTLEIEGKASSRKTGWGFIAEQKKAERDKAKERYDTAVKAHAEELSQLNSWVTEARQQIEKAGNNTAEAQRKASDPLARNKALYRLVRRDLGAAVIFSALMLAMMIVESLSILMKLMAARGSYEEALDAAQQSEINSIQKAAQRAEQEDCFEGAYETILQSELEQVVTALTSPDRSALTDAQQGLAEAFESRVVGGLSSMLRPQPKADGAEPAAKPSASSPSVESPLSEQAVTIVESAPKATLFFKVFDADQRNQERESFAVTLNQAVKDVRLSDIELVLLELRRAWLPPDEQLPECGFFLSNSFDEPLRFGLPVFAQLGNVPMVHAYFVEGGTDAETIH